MAKSEHCFFWFRRDLRTEDNHGLWQALRSGKKVIPVFIFDTHILSELPKKDHRVAFIHEQLCELQKQFRALHSDLVVLHETPLQAWTDMYNKYGAADIYTNRDHEPYAVNRDKEISEFSSKFNRSFF